MLSSVIRIVNFNRLFSNFTAASVRRKFKSNILFLHVSCNTGYVVPTCDNSFKYFNNYRVRNQELTANFSTEIQNPTSSELELSAIEYDRISNETLESLTEYFDEIIEEAEHLNDADVAYGDGVLTVKFGDLYGTYVINRQTPNKQIWLSSPTSGPKRYDFINNKWIYKHDGKSLHELLNAEIPAIVKVPVTFDKCSYSGKDN